MLKQQVLRALMLVLATASPAFALQEYLLEVQVPDPKRPMPLAIVTSSGDLVLIWSGDSLFSYTFRTSNEGTQKSAEIRVGAAYRISSLRSVNDTIYAVDEASGRILVWQALRSDLHRIDGIPSLRQVPENYRRWLWLPRHGYLLLPQGLDSANVSEAMYLLRNEKLTEIGSFSMSGRILTVQTRMGLAYLAEPRLRQFIDWGTYAAVNATGDQLGLLKMEVRDSASIDLLVEWFDLSNAMTLRRTVVTLTSRFAEEAEVHELLSQLVEKYSMQFGSPTTAKERLSALTSSQRPLPPVVATKTTERFMVVQQNPLLSPPGKAIFILIGLDGQHCSLNAPGGFQLIAASEESLWFASTSTDRLRLLHRAPCL